jgi:signal transduction histidine kinase
MDGVLMMGASRAASVGLAAVVLCLAAFSIFAAFATRTQIGHAAKADALAQSYEDAIAVFQEQERLKLRFFLDPSTDSAARLEQAGHDMAEAVSAIAATGDQEDEDLARAMLALHDDFLASTERLLGAMAAGDPQQARRIDENLAQPYFREMEKLLAAAAEKRVTEGRAALAALETTSQWVIVAAPLVFAIGFLLLLAIWRILSQNEQAKQKTYREIEQLSKLRGEFVSTVSHEFRTPLTGIQGFSEMMRDEELTMAQMHEYAGDINKDAMRLARLISDMLDLDQMESGLMTLLANPVDFNRVVSDVAAHFRLGSAGHPIVLDLDEALPKLTGDVDRFTQVVTNLLSNAIKYSPGGGAVELRTRREAKTLMLTVHDHGVGIPTEHLETIFERYSRIESMATHTIQGTGLGLPIVRQIVHLYQGKVWATSEAGAGSVFHVQLPLVAVATPRVPSAVAVG